MGRSRVLSFMSQFSGSHHSQFNGEPKDVYSSTSSPSSSPPYGPISLTNGKSDLNNTPKSHNIINVGGFRARTRSRAVSSPVPASPILVDHDSSPLAVSPISKDTHKRTTSRSSSRPLSMVQAYQPPLMDVNEDTIPELQPIFTFLNSHGNKLYQEGYFLKLDDQNTQGKPNPDRTWTECFAQLVGTVLSLWDAAELDAAGEDGEVLPKFINLTDASIKMIESLPTRSNDETPLQNILSISTAGRNRYLLHFNSKHSLIQWTAGIRLAMFEHSTLQEAYTGALIAGKGKTLNNIGVIMERARTPMDQWVRVRFGAGVPWRRCWCVISPPDEKEFQKAQKEHKKKSPYDRSHAPLLKGDIKFYDSRKDGKKHKKMLPIATISDAYSAYALYPQAKSLIDASTLVKIEGNITIHSDPPTESEGFVFIMPEVHPAVSGFEMMLRFLFPTWDTFGLYGRPGRLVASVLDSRSLMFAMPKHKRYGYLELLDVSGLILTEGSSSWNEREWRKKLKELTGTRMNAMEDGASASSGQTTSGRGKRLSFGPAAGGASKPRVGFADETPPSARTSRSMSLSSRPPPRTDSAPPAADRQPDPSAMPVPQSGHARNASDSNIPGGMPPQPPLHQDSSYASSPASSVRGPHPPRGFVHDLASTPERMSSDEDRPEPPIHDFDGMRRMQTPEPVSEPPSFSHAPGHVPVTRPYHSPEMRRANSRLSMTTLAQLQGAGGVPVTAQALGNQRTNEEHRGPPPMGPDQRGQQPPVHIHVNNAGMSANAGSREALKENQPLSPGLPPPQMDPTAMRSRSPLNQAMSPPPSGPRGPSPGPGQRPKTPTSRPGTASGNQPPPPPGYGPPPSNMGPGPGQRGPPYGMPPPGRGRGRPPPNMGPPGRGRPNYPPPDNMYGGYPPSGPPRGPPPGVPGSGGPGRPMSPANRQPLPPLNTSPSLHRKPLPARTDSLQHRGRGDITPQSPSTSSGSLTGNRIDAAGLGQVRPLNTGTRPPPPPNSDMRRHDTGMSQASSRYDDSASTDSPDYASSRPSTDTASSGERERPRAGVLRTTGNMDDSPVQASRPDFDIPSIDFGPTVNYAAAPRTKTPTPANPLPNAPPRSFSPGPRSFSPAPAPLRKSPGADGGHNRQESDDTVRRSVVWQPATFNTAPNPASQGISAEEYVQQRAAAAAATPLYAHQRHSSGNTLGGFRTGTPTPPLSRGQGQDYIGTAHSRNSSQDLLQRPGSRGAGELLQRPGSRGAGELLQRPGSRGAGAVLGGQSTESHLSAREQEHVARVTGSPLINMATNKQPVQTSGGLVGAIEAREREKQQMKQGWSSQAAQHAINQRQQQQQQHVFQQQFGQPMPPPPAGMYSNMGRGSVPQSPGYGGFGTPSPMTFEQEGSWSPSGAGPGFRSPPPGNFDPRFNPQGMQQPQHAQFSAQSPPPGGRGQNGYPYQGQAF